jgi:glycosyltransferase involved in cell wall biosynthesis/Tfp pilus assembly protein PilF
MTIPGANSCFDAIVFYFWLPEEELNTIFVGIHKWWFAHGLAYRRCIFYGPEIKKFRHFKNGAMDLYAIPSALIKWEALREFLSKKSIGHNPVVSIVVEGDRLPKAKELNASSIPIQCFVADTHHMSNAVNSAIAFICEIGAGMVFVSHSPHRKIFADCLGLNACPLCYTPNDASGLVLNPIGNRGSHACYYGAITDPFHPERTYILGRITSSSGGAVPLDFKPRLQPAKWLESLSKDIASFTCSLNGFPSVQSYAPLLCETCLITDPLSEKSELGPHLRNGENCLIYRNEEEAIKVLEFVKNQPDEVRSIAKAGNSLLHRISPTLNESLEVYCDNTNKFASSLAVISHPHQQIHLNPYAITACYAYEIVQELHRLRKRLFIYVRGESKVAAFIKEYVEILSRVTVLDSAPAELSVPLPEEGECIVWIGNSESCLVNQNKSPNRSLALKIRDSKDANLIGQTRGVLLNPSSMMSCDFEGREFAQYFPENISIIQENKDYLNRTRSLSEIVCRARDLEPETARPMLSACVDMCINDAEALEVADVCAALELVDLERKALLRAVFLNRDCFSALVQLAVLSLESEMPVDAVLLLSEANRVKKLPQSIAPVYSELMGKFSEAPPILKYKQALAGGTHPLPVVTRRILVVTNLFPPQEMGGYGRKIWEFANGLKARGHTVEVLTSNSDYLGKKPDESELALESIVRRELVLKGEWKDGKTRSTSDTAGQRKIGEANTRNMLEAVRRFSPDVVLLGNLDFLGVELLHGTLKRGIPVIHSLGNQRPGYQAADSIKSPLYVIAPASDWLGRNLLSLGYTAPRLETVYPGARIDRFYRHFLPDARRLRIAFAGLVMPYKGPQLLLDALVKLHQAEIDFEMEFAGDSIDQEFVEKLRAAAAAHGIGDRVRFSGFLSRTELSTLFARSNVLVFPTLVPEAFGISQVEAMAGGLIVLTSGTGGTTEVVRHLEDGIVFDPKDSASLAKWLARLANDPLLMKQLQAQARGRALDFSVTASVVVIERIVESLLNKDAGELSEPTGSGRSEGAGKPFPPASATLEVALSAFNAGRLAEAEDVCRELLQADEKCAAAWNLMARMAALNVNLDSAGDFGALACDLEPGNAGFARFLAEVNLDQGKLEPAERQVRRALEMAPDSPEGFVLLGRILAEKDDKTAALEAFQDALRVRKDYAEGFSHYATALQKFGRGKDAISRIRKACSLAPDSVEFQTILAMLLEQNSRWEDALAAYGKAARMNPDVGFVWFRQGKLLNGLRRYAEAIPVLEKAISKPGVLGEYFYEMGLALDMSKRFPEALEYYNKALEAGYNTAKSDASSAPRVVP